VIYYDVAERQENVLVFMARELMNVFPVFFFQEIGQGQEHEDKKQNVFAHALPFHLHGFADIDQEVDQVVDELIKFFFG
jgi:hypothetical protein